VAFDRDDVTDRRPEVLSLGNSLISYSADCGVSGEITSTFEPFFLAVTIAAPVWATAGPRPTIQTPMPPFVRA